MGMNRGQRPYDTDKDTASRQLETLRKMDISARADMTFQLSDNLRSIVEAGIKQRHPDYSPRQITRAVLRLTVGKELFEQVFPGCQVQP